VRAFPGFRPGYFQVVRPGRWEERPALVEPAFSFRVTNDLRIWAR